MNAQMKEASSAATDKASQEEQRQRLNSLAILEESQASSKVSPSVLTEFAWKYIERDISVVPIAPNSKKPGQWSQDHGWRGMSDWSRFADRLPTQIELDYWDQWPEAGIGVVLGKTSRIVALDKDYDLPAGGDDALNAIIPYSPVAKKGQKGWTKFYRYNGEPSRSFDAAGHRVLDVLSDGRQTVVPPTAHPSGCNYVWLTEETLDNILSVDELPQLPDDFMEQVERVLAPYQTEQDRQYQKKAHAPKDAEDAIGSRTAAGQYYAELNAKALENLDLWVTKLVPHSRRHGDSYRTIATWRACEKPNVGIHPDGIMDWGGNYGLTPIDLVMHANSMPFQQAAEALGNCLPRLADEDWLKNFKVNGVVIGTPLTPGRQQQSQSVQTSPWPNWPQAPQACDANLYRPKSDEEWAKEQESQNQAQEMPEVLLNPPGILGEITSWVLDGAIKPSFPLSLVAAISMVATALAQKVKNETGLRTNLYLVASAGTGNGKDHGRKCFKELFQAADLDDMLAGEDFASGPGLLNAVYRNPKSAFLMDEFGLYMQEASKQKNSPKASVIPTLMRLSTSAGQVMKGTEYADERIRPRKDIQYPCINLLATTTPESIYEALTTADVESGFLNRMLVVDVPAKRFPMVLKESAPPPEGVVAWIKAAQACSDGLRGVMPDNPFLIATTPEAHTVFEELYELAQDHEHGSKPTGKLWARAFEQAVKVALVVACASVPNAIEFSQRLKDGSIKIDQQAAVWACAFVKHAITSLQREAESRMASTEIARIALAVEGVLKKAGPRGKTRSELGRACAKFKDQPPRVQQDVIDMLKVREDVVEHTFPPASGRGKGREAFIHRLHVDPAV